MQNRQNRKTSVFAAACAAVVALTVSAHAQEVVLRFAHEAPETTIKGQTANKLAELVKEYTDGAVEVQVFPGAQLVPTVDELRAVSRGQVDIVAPYTSYFSAIDQAWDVFYQPTLFDTPQQAIEVFAGPVGRSVLDRVKENGLVGLSIWHDGPVYAFSKDKEIRVPADMAGLAARVAPSAPLEMLLENLSATAVALPAPEVYLALQQGVANAVVTTPTYAGPARWHEVLQHGTRVMWGVGGYGVVMNPRSLESLSDEQREAFLRAVDDAAAWNQEQAIGNINHWEATLAENGVKWYDPTDEERELWKAEGSKIWETQSDIIKEYVAEIRK